MSSGLLTISAAVRSETAARERLDRRVAVLAEHQRHDLEPGRRGRGRIAGMRLDRRDHLVAALELAARGVVGAGDAGVRVRRVRAAARLEDEPVHPREPAEDLVEPVDELEDALERLVVLVRVELGELRPRRERLVEPRVVLHRAGAEQADPHHPERLLREVQVVAQHLRLGQLRQRRAAPRAASAPGRARRVADPLAHLGLGVGEDEPAAARRPSSITSGSSQTAAWYRRRPFIASTSSSAAASRSMSARVCISVTQ